jgi:hypothetical protein
MNRRGFLAASIGTASTAALGGECAEMIHREYDGLIQV